MKKRVLIIEDEVSIAELQRDYLVINGYEVEIEKTGDRGLSRSLKEDFDLIILDLMLPNIDGFEICRKVREFKNTPILMVSARKEDIDKIRGLGLGADDYITKPFSPNELVARVTAHITRYKRLVGSNEKKTETINIRNLVIDKDSRRVWIESQEISLTCKEFDLLLFMAQNPNRVFSREELFDSVWGMEAFGDISTVTVHIKKVREKIKKKLDSDNPSDWNLAIIDADKILDEMLVSMGYPGENLGERLKAVESSDFLTLNQAWEAHKIRNQIAHEDDFVLTQREAKATIAKFEEVFKEFNYI
ncbi:MAG: Transcriptional regulatory protein SrrA [Firmicutes bacterium ADurb.Bin419]|nr:MAG: Transcriptional regulatory protein SrrA [Firmicutes bacterium ADurb.Bin419]